MCRPHFRETVEAHIAWLDGFNAGRVQWWKKLLRTQPEAAICEAKTREMLQAQEVQVEPFEDPSSGGPDYRCTKDGQHFYVEVTCLTKKQVTQASNLPDQPTGGRHYGLLTENFLTELCNKTRQCSGLLDPCLVALCSLHMQGGVHCFGKRGAEKLLTGTPKLVIGRFDPDEGRLIGDCYQRTDLEDSAFIRYLRNNDGVVEFARNPISGVLLCAYRRFDQAVYGVFHPSPNHPFERGVLPGIEFCRLKDGWQNGTMTVEWI